MNDHGVAFPGTAEDVTKKGFELVELSPGVTLEEVREKTGAPVHDRTG